MRGLLALFVALFAFSAEANQPKWLELMNQYRAMAKQPPVTEDPALSRGDAIHAEFTAKNKVLEHAEEPSFARLHDRRRPRRALEQRRRRQVRAGRDRTMDAGSVSRFGNSRSQAEDHGLRPGDRAQARPTHGSTSSAAWARFPPAPSFRSFGPPTTPRRRCSATRARRPSPRTAARVIRRNRDFRSSCSSARDCPERDGLRACSRPVCRSNTAS